MLHMYTYMYTYLYESRCISKEKKNGEKEK